MLPTLVTIMLPEMPVHIVEGIETAAQYDCEITCGPVCEWIFERIQVWPLIAGGTRVEWTLHPRFADPQPHTFQLQVGRTGVHGSEWCDVGLPVANGFFAVDDTKRIYGKDQWTHYRVVLTTPQGSYASKPQHALGNLDKRDWLRAREISRLESLRLRKEAGQDGFLLKRRLFGEACTCLDSQTQEIRNPQCTVCYGTGFLNGYYPAVPCFYVELSTRSIRNHLDTGSGKGTINSLPKVVGRMLNVPQVFSYDVWVDRDTDFRWIIHTVANKVEIRGVPIVLSAEMRLAPYSHAVYQVEIEDQIPV
jgi:hypothetical protein